MILDPHIKVSEDYFVHTEGMALQYSGDQANVSNIFIRANTSTVDPFFGGCWPGTSTWVDFLNENAQQFWAGLYSTEKFLGSNWMYSAWNDMNEPSVFTTSTKTMPLDAIHVKADGTMYQHRDVHNAYGGLQQRSSYKGLLARDGYNRRPFVLTRSFFLGSQKFGTYWTGDNRAIFSELDGSMTMILQLGNAGHPFGGSDVPGFYGMPTEDLWVMFYQLGMYYPFFRAHTHLDFPNREPWMQTQRVQEAIRDAINRRYDLIHYIYTTFEATTRTAEPLMRTMWNEFPHQDAMWDVSTQFMFGGSLLVAPKLTKPDDLLSSFHRQSVNYILPDDELWYNYYTKQQQSETGTWKTTTLPDLEQAVFVRGGSVLPILLHEDCMALLPCIRNPVRLEVYLDENDEASGELYLDDGETYEFQNNPDGHARIQFSYSGNTLSSSNVDGTNYSYGEDQLVTQAVIYGFKSSPADVLSGAIEVDYTYIPEQQALLINTSERTTDIWNVGIEVVWN